MSRPKTPVPLVDKIAQAFKAVGKLQRAGTNTKRHYKWTRATDVFEAVRLEFFNRGVLVIHDEGTPEYVAIAQSNGGEQITECRLPVKYSFKDATGEIGPFTVHGVGRDVEDKALYKAQTGAQKALLKRFGLMAEEVDDPEWDGSQAPAGENPLDDAAPMRTPRKEKPLAAYQIDNIREAMANTGKTEEQLSQAVASIGHAAELTQMKQKYFKELFKWASDGRGTVAPPKPEAVPAQPALPLRAAPPVEMRIGNKTVEFQPKDKPYAI
jgi:hypothetical protein